MQLTNPAFLFLFMPLALLLIPLAPSRMRRPAIAALSVLWFLFVCRETPISLLTVGGVVLLSCILSLLPDKHPRLRCALGVSVPLATLLASRLLAEYAPHLYAYPTGLTMVVLAAVSLSIDRYRGDAPERDGPVAVISYLLFFPNLLVGPILRYKQFLYVIEHQAPSRVLFSEGAHLFMLGYIKRMAIAAVLMRAVRDILSFSDEPLPIVIVLLLPFMAYALVISLLSGTTDMARGLMAMLGLRPARGQVTSSALLFPHRVFYNLLLSFDRYLEDYVGRPLMRRFPRAGRLLCALLVFTLTVLLYRTRPEALLLALPVLLFSLAFLKKSRWRRCPGDPLLRSLCSVLCTLLLSILFLGLMLDNPLDVITLVRNAELGLGSASIFRVFSAVSDTRYLLLCLALAVLIPLVHYYPLLSRRLPRRVAFVLRCASSLVLFAGFFATLIYFMPQFPQYADPRYGTFFSVR